MENVDELDTKTRTINKFYNRIRSHLHDLVVTEPERAKPVTEKSKKIKEEAIYGLVEDKELHLFLKAYEQQPNKPVKCDQLEASSLSKLLFSKPGFHNADSTAYLIEDLRINDRNRNSFLGGHSTYTVKKEHSLSYIKDSQLKMSIKQRSKELLDEMDKSCFEFVRWSHVQQLASLNPKNKNGDILAVEGRYLLLDRDYDHAIPKLKDALESNSNYVEYVKGDLSIALFEKGLKSYRSQKLQEAFGFFEASLRYNPSNESARMHLDLCNGEIIRAESRPFGIRDSYTSYNQRRK